MPDAAARGGGEIAVTTRVTGPAADAMDSAGPLLAPVFGVRHFSPGAAVHVERWLDGIDPQVVMIEGPADAGDQFRHLAHAATRPPVALLAYTTSRPLRSLLYPLASYSPEWVALRWAMKNKREVRFIDLPAAVFLEIHQILPAPVPAEGRADVDEAEGAAAAEPAPAPAEKFRDEDHTQAYLDDPYGEIARISGDGDHETWWERNFEHSPDTIAYHQATLEFGRQLRAIRRDSPAREAETLLREAFMRREIRAALTGGRRGAVICGAFHASVLREDLAPMGDEEFATLPRAPSSLTLMPYSYPRLSAQSGYGAGNHAPVYYQMAFDLMKAGQAERIPAQYLSSLAQRLRRIGQVRSSAEVIEAVRLAGGLAAMNGCHVPVLRDLRDAAVTLLGQGDAKVLVDALRELEIGSAVGTLPPGVSRTALHDDFHQSLKTLRLESYIVDKEQKLELDLRENRTVKTREAAFIGRVRSTFLNRLEVMHIGFATLKAREQRGTAKEMWSLRWMPECEIRLAEKSMVANSIENGAAWALSEMLKEATDVGRATTVLLNAANCELADALLVAVKRVQDLSVEEAGFPSAAKGIQDLAQLVRYGNVRDVDPAPLKPVLAQLYLRATLLLHGATVCDDEAVKAVREAIDRVQDAAFLTDGELDAAIDPELWLNAVTEVARSDSRHPFLSGYATALLIERGRIDDEALDREVARRLSPGTEASVGVNWFEGLVQRNRAALFLREALWASLARYVDDLDDEDFRRGLLYLRRAFSSFTPGEIRRVVEILHRLWKGGGEALATALERTLDADEVTKVVGDLDGLELL